MKSIKPVFLVLIFSLMFSGCEEIEKEKFSHYGKVAGVVNGQDYYDNQDSEGVLKDAEVVLDRGDIRFVDYTNENGQYAFDSIPYGSYNISVSYAGYSSQYRFGEQFQFIDSVRTRNFDLNIIPIVDRIVSAKIFQDYNGRFAFNIDYEPSDEEIYFVVFLGNDENVSYKNYQDFIGPWGEGLDPENYPRFYYAIYTCCGQNYGYEYWVEPETQEQFPYEFDTEVLHVGYYDRYK